MLNKIFLRDKRKKKIRKKIKTLNIIKLSVYKSSNNIYASIIDPKGKVLGSSSTLKKNIKKIIPYGGNIKAAEIVGKDIANIAKKYGLKKVAFDRSGYKYHGRIKKLADAARQGGLEF